MEKKKRGRKPKNESLEIIWAYEEIREENKRLRSRIEELEKELNKSTREVVEYKKKLIKLHYFF